MRPAVRVSLLHRCRGWLERGPQKPRELARNREALLYQIEKAVSEPNGLSPAETLEKVKALVTSRA